MEWIQSSNDGYVGLLPDVVNLPDDAEFSTITDKDSWFWDANEGDDDLDEPDRMFQAVRDLLDDWKMNMDHIINDAMMRLRILAKERQTMITCLSGLDHRSRNDILTEWKEDTLRVMGCVASKMETLAQMKMAQVAKSVAVNAAPSIISLPTETFGFCNGTQDQSCYMGLKKLIRELDHLCRRVGANEALNQVPLWDFPKSHRDQHHRQLVPWMGFSPMGQWWHFLYHARKRFLSDRHDDTVKKESSIKKDKIGNLELLEFLDQGKKRIFLITKKLPEAEQKQRPQRPPERRMSPPRVQRKKSGGYNSTTSSLLYSEVVKKNLKGLPVPCPTPMGDIFQVRSHNLEQTKTIGKELRPEPEQLLHDWRHNLSLPAFNKESPEFIWATSYWLKVPPQVKNRKGSLTDEAVIFASWRRLNLLNEQFRPDISGKTKKSFDSDNFFASWRHNFLQQEAEQDDRLHPEDILADQNVLPCLDIHTPCSMDTLKNGKKCRNVKPRRREKKKSH